MRRARAGVFVLALLALAGCEPTKPAHWVDEARLHDGRTVDVERTVYFHYGHGELSDALKQWPDQYSLKLLDPDTRDWISWKGERGFVPLVIDFARGTAWLAMVQDNTYGNLKQYGCPEIPYVFMRYDPAAGRWSQVAAAQFPRELLTGNLSPSFYDSGSMTPAMRSAEDILRGYKGEEYSTSNHITRIIPADFATWPAKYKNQWRVGHHEDGCADTVPSNKDTSHIQWPGHPSWPATLEVLSVRIYDPEWIVTGDAPDHRDDWTAMAFGREQDAHCRAFLKLVGDDSDRPELRGWYLFVNDPTGNKKARGGWGGLACNERDLWFVEYAAERGRVVITKFTTGGDPVYRLSFARPDEPGGAPGGIMQPSFRSSDGYLYFDWVNSSQAGRYRRVKRQMQVRVREPE